MTTRFDPDAGLTLIEMLVVLAIIGIASGMTLLSLGGGRRSLSSEAEAHALANQLQLAADQTLLGDRSLALAVDPHGYAIVSWDAAHARWLALNGDGFSGRHELTSGVRTLPATTKPIPIETGGTGNAVEVVVGGSSDSASSDAAGGTYSSSANRTGWRVSFDGLTAAVTPASAPVPSRMSAL